MKRYVEEIASDARMLEEKLNSLSAQLALETIVWANGKLFVVLRERSQEDHQPIALGVVPGSSGNREAHTKSDQQRKLPRAGTRIRKAKDIQ